MNARWIGGVHGTGVEVHLTGEYVQITPSPGNYVVLNEQQTLRLIGELQRVADKMRTVSV